jgi:hypothetical protein
MGRGIAVCKTVGYPADFRFSIVMRGDGCQKDPGVPAERRTVAKEQGMNAGRSVVRAI